MMRFALIFLVFSLLLSLHYSGSAGQYYPSHPAGFPNSDPDSAITYNGKRYKRIWQNKGSQYFSDSYNLNEESILLHHDTLYFLEGHPETWLNAVDLNNQKLIWSYPFYHNEYTRLVKKDGLIFVNGTRIRKGIDFLSTQIIALDAHSGTEKWHYEISEDGSFQQAFDLAYLDSSICVLEHDQEPYGFYGFLKMVQIDPLPGQKSVHG